MVDPITGGAWVNPVRAPGWSADPLPEEVLEPARVVRWGCGDVAIGLLLWIGGSILLTLPVLFITNEKAPVSIAALLGGWAGMVSWLFVASRRKGLGTLRDDFGLAIVWWRDLPLGLGCGFLAMLAAGIVRYAVAAALGGEAITNTDDILGRGTSTAAVLAIGLLATFGAPVVEELFFRGLTLRAVARRWGTSLGVIVSTVLFALPHWQPGSVRDVASLVAGIAMLGLVFGLLAVRRRRLGPSIVAHATVNGTAVIFYLSSLVPPS